MAELTDAVSRRVAGDPGVPGVWVLSGMGGSGKTTVALETAHRLASASTRVWWVSGADPDTMSTALRAVAVAAGAREADFAGAHPADVLWSRLDALDRPWLLVLDNVDDPSALAAGPSRTAEGIGWLRPPGRSCGAVLITSRESRGDRWGHWVRMSDVGLLSGEDGARVLRDLAPRAGTARDALELAEHLGGLPLALDLAGSYLARTQRSLWPSASMPDTFAAYRRRLDAHLGEMAADPDTDLGPAERTRRAIVSTWELSLDLLHRQGTDLARPLLRLLSAFGLAPLPYREVLDIELLASSGLFTDPTHSRLHDALTGLAGLKLITIEKPNAEPTERPTATAAEPDHGSLWWITLHPMVRAAGRSHADFPPQAPLVLRLVTALLLRVTSPLDAGRPADWPLWHAITPHCAAARTLLSVCERVAPHSTDADLVAAATEPGVRAAQYLTFVGMYAEAMAELEALGRDRSRLLGAEHPATIAARLHLAWALRDSGDLGGADRLYQDVARVGERALPDGHPYLQSARTGRARTLRELGQYEAAEVESRVALAMRRRDPHTAPLGILRIRHDLATLAYKRGRLEEAVTELREVQRLTVAMGGESDLDALAMGVSLARALRDAGHAEEAEGIANGVVRQYLKVLAPDHPSVLVARHERARTIRDHESDPERLRQARDEFADIWQINKRRFGPDHPAAVAARHELATVWHLLGRPDLAARHFRAALEAAERRLGDHHPDVAVCARNLAMVLAELADLTGLSLAEALSPEAPPAGSHPARERMLARFVRPRLSRGGGNPPGSEYSPVTNTPQPPGPDTGGGTSFGYRPRSTPLPAAGPNVPRREPEAPFPSPGAVRALATGAEDRALIQRLRAQQRGVRVLALGELLTMASGASPDTAAMVRRVRTLLLQADQADPEAVTAVLLHPPVGRWLSRALRSLHTPGEGPAGPASADLPHLYAIAAATALRARLTFTLPIPLRDGFAFLPTLGAADLRGAGATTAHVVAEEDSAVVRCADSEVRLPTSADPSPPHWVLAHRVRTPVGRGRFDLVLDDMDPYRETDGPVAPRPLSPGETNHWRRMIHNAGTLLAGVDPRQAMAMTAALATLTPRPEAQSATMTSISSSDAFGGIVLSTPSDSVELAVTLVHEFRHMKLNAVLDFLDLYEGGGEQPEDGAYYAPWRDDPRPFPGFFHGVFAFFGVVDFWQRLTHQASGKQLRHAQFQLLYWRAQTRDAFTTLRSSPRLTAAGRDFTAVMGDGLAAWTDHAAVPIGVTIRAMEAVAAHRCRWRLHHLRPEADAVAEVAEAWLSGASRPPRQHVTAVPCQDPAVPSLNDHTALLCRAATDPSLVHRAAKGHGPVVFDPADLARLRGDVEEARRLSTDQVARGAHVVEPWARLQLALRRPNAMAPIGATAAARALARHPEVVRAVHARVTAATGTLVDPVALAAWIGAPDRSADPSGWSPGHGEGVQADEELL
ncbi:HEXXH motif-containing putative peptide modification protein [Streptomyces sp. NBC_01565]|nr:HEXXH motif-containing putative peptide modification protein [Streptomyces sp. NBC_01565]